MELTIKHLAAYLPYGLKVSNSINFAEFGICENTIELLEGYNFDNVITDKSEFKIEYCILHLRPLSDLTKEITINGETFVPIYKLWELAGFEIGRGQYIETSPNYIKTSNYGTAQEFRINISDITSSSYNVVQKLLSWHFDCFGLIENNLAININEINNL